MVEAATGSGTAMGVHDLERGLGLTLTLLAAWSCGRTTSQETERSRFILRRALGPLPGMISKPRRRKDISNVFTKEVTEGFRFRTSRSYWLLLLAPMR
jgi:hypothetical protein